MNSLEIIQQNIHFDHPDRVGLRFNSLGVSDVFRIYLLPPRDFIPDDARIISMQKKIRTLPGSVDEWGCRWEVLEDISGDDMGQVLDPPLKNLEDLPSYTFPDPYNPDRFFGLNDVLDKSDGKFVQLNSPFCMFERMHFIRGFEKTLEDLVLRPELAETLLDKLMEFQIGISEMAGKLGKGRIHCFDMTDDWGTQNNLFISPAMWRKYFKPRYEKLIDVIHKNGMFIRFHSDGKINSIIQDLIEIGVDILNVHQPLLLGIDEISDNFRGKVCFEVSADIQVTLPGGNRDAIRKEVQEIIQKWATPNGGLIGVEYRYGKAIGISQQALEWELEAFQDYGKFS